MNTLPLCSPVEFQVSLTFIHHLNYKWEAGIYAWIRSAARLPNKQSIDGRSNTRQFQRPSGKKTLSLSQLIRSHLYCYERVSRIEGLEPMSLLTTVLRCCPKTLSHCRQSSLSLTSGLTTVLRCCRKTLRQSSLGHGDMLHIPQDNMA